MTGPARPAATRRRQAGRGRLVPTCEGLEVRRLLAGDTTLAFATLLFGDVDRSDAATQTATTATERTDRYVLEADGTWPAATIEIRWATGPGSIAGRIVVSNAWGQVRLDAPLAPSATFDQSVGISIEPEPTNRMICQLNVKVRFLDGPDPGGDPQSYLFEANYIPPPVQSPQNLAPPGSPPDLIPPVLSTAQTVSERWPPRSFTASAFLPTFPVANDGPNIPGGPPAIPLGPAPLLPPPGVPITPASPGRPVVPDVPAPSVVGSPQGWGGVRVPIPLPDPAPGRTATMVGPLPMGPSVEDGGLLARPPGPNSLLVGTGDRAIRATVATRPDELVSARVDESHVQPDPSTWISAPVDVLPADPSAALPFAVELAATGVAFLPPIPPAPPSGVQDRPTVAAPLRPGPEPEPEPGQGPRWSRLPALVAATLVGSTTLVAHLTRADQGAAGWRRTRSAIAASVGRSPRSRSARPAR